jgi:hypothetical protein
MRRRRIRIRYAVLLAAGLSAEGALSFVMIPPDAATATRTPAKARTRMNRTRRRTGALEEGSRLLHLGDPRIGSARRRVPVPALFVRNIDLPEAIIFYDVFCDHHGTENNEDWRPLLKQCGECGTAAIVIGGDDGDGGGGGDAAERRDGTSGAAPGVVADLVTLAVQRSVLPPNPKDLLGALDRIVIQPRPFGGSSGFAASRLAEPSRPPMASRTVVIGKTEGHSLAARYAGIRAVSLDEHDDLADAVLSLDDVQSLWLEDLATPGSFWLNPPHPRDEHGNRVNPDRLVAIMERANQESDRDARRVPNESSPEESFVLGETEDESEIRRILADLSPL